MERIMCSLRRLAAVLAGLALVAALPAPCGCAPERSPSEPANEHACCTPQAGLSDADRTCCDESPAGAVAYAAPSPVGSAAAPAQVAALHVGAPSALLAPPRPAVSPAYSPPPTVLRI
jgi:hypothetical protein